MNEIIFSIMADDEASITDQNTLNRLALLAEARLSLDELRLYWMHMPDSGLGFARHYLSAEAC